LCDKVGSDLAADAPDDDTSGPLLSFLAARFQEEGCGDDQRKLHELLFDDASQHARSADEHQLERLGKLMSAS
jgi:hypothetical protein